MDGELSQEQANSLIYMKKEFLNESDLVLNDNFNFERELRSTNKQELFILSLYQGRLDLKKVTYNKRHNKGITLIRIDLTNGQHTNPDGKKIIGPHIHIYKEGYGDSFAIPLPNKEIGITNLEDCTKCLDEFFKYCNIKPINIIKQSLFGNLQ